MKMLPSIGPFAGMQKAADKVDEKQITRVEAIINSMTAYERDHHEVDQRQPPQAHRPRLRHQRAGSQPSSAPVCADAEDVQGHGQGQLWRQAGGDEVPGNVAFVFIPSGARESYGYELFLSRAKRGSLVPEIPSRARDLTISWILQLIAFSEWNTPKTEDSRTGRDLSLRSRFQKRRGLSEHNLSLTRQLEELTAKLRAMVPADRLAVVDRSVEALMVSGIADHALKVGETAPALSCPTVTPCCGVQKICCATDRW